MLTAHARDPYSGPRRIVVAMGKMFAKRTSCSRGNQPKRAEKTSGIYLRDHLLHVNAHLYEAYT